MDKRILNLRKEIDKIDENIITLLKNRMDCSKKVGDLKTTLNIPVEDKDRENEIIQRLGELANGHLKEEQLMRIFARHVSSDVAEEIWQKRDEFLAEGRPRPQRLMATILFVDLRGYTARAETMDPAALMDWVGEFMERMAHEISLHGGVVDDYFGDGIKADFGIPVPRREEKEVDQDARSAVEAALAMASALGELNAGYRRRGLPECGRTSI